MKIYVTVTDIEHIDRRRLHKGRKDFGSYARLTNVKISMY